MHQELLETLYDGSETLLASLRALFYAKALNNGEVDTACTASLLELAIKSAKCSRLVRRHPYRLPRERNPNAKSETKNAGPLLHRMMLHYGFFPFPTDQKLMTCGVFLRAVALLSRTRYRVLWRDYGFMGEAAVTRQRRAADDVRILFQSVASGDLHHLGSQDQRSVEDDEDLLDALVMVLENTIERQQIAEISYNRESVLQTAAALPCSLPRNLSGFVALGDLRSIFDLIASLSTIFVGPMPSHTSSAVDCSMQSFSLRSDGAAHIDWENFCDVLLSAFVRHSVVS